MIKTRIKDEDQISMAIKKPSHGELFLCHITRLNRSYFAASPQAGTTACIRGLSIFIEQAMT